MVSRFETVLYDAVCGEQQRKLRIKFKNLEEFYLKGLATEKVWREHLDDVKNWVWAEYPKGRCNPLGDNELDEAYNEAQLETDSTLLSLECAYHWYGKAIRDQQIQRNAEK